MSTRRSPVWNQKINSLGQRAEQMALAFMNKHRTHWIETTGPTVRSRPITAHFCSSIKRMKKIPSVLYPVVTVVDHHTTARFLTPIPQQLVAAVNAPHAVAVAVASSSGGGEGGGGGKRGAGRKRIRGAS